MRNKKLIILFCILTFVTLLIVICSVIFSVKSVHASCYNYDDAEMDKYIASESVNGIEIGKSIFLVDEEEVIKLVESAVKDVEVVNVERKFPNRVYINYVRVYSYFAIETENQTLFVSTDGKIISSGESATSYTDHIVYKGDEYSGTNVGEKLYSSTDSGKKNFDIIVDAVESIAEYGVAMEIFESIDTTKTDETGITYFYTRTGAVFQIQGGSDNMIKKLRLAVSTYVADETKYMDGIIIVNASGNLAYHGSSDGYTG